MEYANDLESGSSPKIRKAAEKISKLGLEGYCSYLINALTCEIEKPKAWKTQCQLIKTLALTNCTDAIPLLKQLAERDFHSSVLYKELGFAIFMLENITTTNLDFLIHSFDKENQLLISGACSGLLYKKITPSVNEIKTIISGVSKYTEDEGKIITPRCYIALAAHSWPLEETKQFLESCKNSHWSGLVEIATNSLNNKESKIRLV